MGGLPHRAVHIRFGGIQLIFCPRNLCQSVIEFLLSPALGGALAHGANDVFRKVQRAVAKGQVDLSLDSALLLGRCAAPVQPDHLDGNRKQHQRQQQREAATDERPPGCSVNEVA